MTVDSKHGPGYVRVDPLDAIPHNLRSHLSSDDSRALLTVWENSTKFRRIVCEALNKMILSKIKSGEDATDLMMLRSICLLYTSPSPRDRG